MDYRGPKWMKGWVTYFYGNSPTIFDRVVDTDIRKHLTVETRKELTTKFKYLGQLMPKVAESAMLHQGGVGKFDYTTLKTSH